MSRPVAVVTGASSGIGAATARQLLALGHNVAITGRDPEKLKQLTDENLLAVQGDAASWTDVQEWVRSTVERFGRLDAVIANAGFASHDSLDDGDPGVWREMVLTNVLGPALLIKAALPALKRSRGRIVLVGSVAGLIHTPGNIYGATKWAITGLAENTRLMVTGDGIGVTLVSPGATDTGFFERIGGPPERPGGYLSAGQMAATIVWAVTQPSGVDINTLTVRPVGSPR